MDKDQITTELLTWLKDAAEKGGSFVEREAPMLAEEIVAWEKTSGLMSMSAGLAFLAFIGVSCLVIWRTKWEAQCTAGQVVAAGMGIASVFFLVFAPLLLVLGATDYVKATVAPRVVIVEYLTGATK